MVSSTSAAAPAEPRIQRLPLDAACDGHRLHGDDRQPAIWLDAVRRSDRCEISLGPRGDPARLHALRGDRDLAGAGRGLVRRQIRPARRHRVRRRDDRARLDPQLLCRLARAALCRRHHRRHRRRLGLRHLRRQCAEMVSRSPRPRRGRDRCRFRRGRGAHRGADRKHDRRQRLSERVLHLRHRTRRDRVHPRLLPAPAVGRDAGQEEAAQPAADQDRLHAAAGAARADLLDHVSGVRDGRLRRPDGGGADRADRARLQDRQRAGQPARLPDGRADLCDLARSHLRRFRPAVLRLGLRQYRPREHHVHRVRHRRR